MKNEYFAILNTERNRFLTSANGVGIWKYKESAQNTLDTEFGGQSHLEIVKVKVEENYSK